MEINKDWLKLAEFNKNVKKLKVDKQNLTKKDENWQKNNKV